MSETVFINGGFFGQVGGSSFGITYGSDGVTVSGKTAGRPRFFDPDTNFLGLEKAVKPWPTPCCWRTLA